MSDIYSLILYYFSRSYKVFVTFHFKVTRVLMQKTFIGGLLENSVVILAYNISEMIRKMQVKIVWKSVQWFLISGDGYNGFAFVVLLCWSPSFSSRHQSGKRILRSNSKYVNVRFNFT